MATGQQMLEDAFAFAVQLLAYLFIVSCAPGNFGLFLFDGPLDRIETPLLIEEEALCSVIPESRDFLLELLQRMLRDERRDFRLTATIAILFELASGDAGIPELVAKRRSQSFGVFEQVSLERRHNIVKQLGLLDFTACIGVAVTPDLALLAAHCASPVRIVEKAADFLSPLPLETLSADAAMCMEEVQAAREAAFRLLHRWGIHTLGAFAALPREQVVARLGGEAAKLWDRAAGRAERPLRLVRAPEVFAEAMELENEVETLEPLLFLLRRFIDQLAPRLETCGKVAGQLVLRLGLESGDPLERRLRVPQPTRQADVLFRMLHTHLETVRSDSAIVTVTLRIEPAEPEHKQFNLFEAALRDPQQFQDTIARLTALLGSDRVGTPVRENSHRPDAFRMVPPDFENAPRAAMPRVAISRGAVTARPVALRRLRPAEKAEVTTTAGAAAPTPVALQCTVARGKLKLVLGPWRASGHWWEPGAWQRDEWDITTQSGQTLRLAHQPDGWTVEGMLD